MAKIDKLPGQAIIDGFKGVIDYYVHNGVACVRKWPNSPGHLRAPAVMAGWLPFTAANQLWATLSKAVKDAYNDMAVSTNLTGKDIFVKTYINKKSLELNIFSEP